MSDEEKLECISLSVEVFNNAAECFKLSGGTDREH